MDGPNQTFSSLNQAKYLFLREISEPRENSLRLIVEEAMANVFAERPMPSPNDPLYEILKGGVTVESTSDCRKFELHWTRYVAYLITEEMVASGGNRGGEVYAGNLFRTYTESRFLDYISRYTGNHFEPVQHYELICENHIIDIASYRPPEIRLLEAHAASDRPKIRPN
jgi:hypothetical protein